MVDSASVVYNTELLNQIAPHPPHNHQGDVDVGHAHGDKFAADVFGPWAAYILRNQGESEVDQPDDEKRIIPQPRYEVAMEESMDSTLAATTGAIKPGKQLERAFIG